MQQKEQKLKKRPKISLLKHHNLFTAVWRYIPLAAQEIKLIISFFFFFFNKFLFLFLSNLQTQLLNSKK